ncbi:MAG: CpsB/CapC family capsule biosynthesis tyrosine phosphatase [Planctomycetota bacterium]
MTGFIDLHSHLLPGLDDGCVDVGESLACVRRLIEAGFVGTVCTSHMAVGFLPHVTPTAVADGVARLRSVLADEGIDYRLWTGGELRLGTETPAWLDRHGVPTLGDGPYVLTDYWGDMGRGGDWPDACEETLDRLLADGYRPILAHPERMTHRDDDALDTLLDRLTAKGVLLQGNLKPLAGRDAPGTLERATRYLSAGRYFTLAVDMHRPDSLEDRLAGIDAVRTRAGDDAVRRLLAERPREILGDVA